MKTEFKDLAHLYIGCDVINISAGGEWLIDNIETLSHQLLFEIVTGEPWKDWKPILRPLSDLSDNEAIEIAKMADDVLELCIRDEDPEIIRDKYTIQVCYKDIHAERGREDKRFIIWIKGKPWLTHQTPVCNFQYITAYLLKQGFDLFGLIESGQALNKTKI